MAPKTSLLLALGALLVAGCTGKDDVADGDSLEPIPVDSSQPLDADGDNVTADEGDCDDNDAEVYPGRAEDCNGADDNCNGLVDEGFPNTDGDEIADCVDTEECDGVDNDGDGDVDEGFADNDGNGVADCVGDEICDGLDNDDDGLVDEGFDADGDGVTQCADDCDDSDASSYPGAEEVDGDGADNDCDGMIDETGWAEGALSIVEIMNNPGAVGDPKGEWFEVYNGSGSDLYMDGLLLRQDDGDSHQIASDANLLVPAGGRVVLGSNGKSDLNGGVTVDYQYSGLSLSNESDNLQIVADGVVLDEVMWDDGATMPDLDGASMSLDPWFSSATDNDDANNWCRSLDSWAAASDAGSPGLENELCSHVDHDGDGFIRDEGDCDDTNSRVYPGAPEIDAGVDNDCDGEVETMPVAVADYDASSSLESCDTLTLDATGSSDADGDPLTYLWELTSAPSGSSATSSDINSTTDAQPTFTPDVTGTYVFGLTVDDGGASSYPTSLTVVITSATSNTSPVADAGSDQSDSGSVTCSSWSYGSYYTCDDCSDTDFDLDGTGSSDAESSVWMTYSWSILSGSGYGSLDDASSSAPVLTVSGVEATYGSTNSQDVIVGLKVTDCYGATSSSDTVTVTLECTGS